MESFSNKRWSPFWQDYVPKWESRYESRLYGTRYLLFADNTTLDPGAGGDTIADEDIAGVKYQKIKLIDSTAGSVTPVGTAANPIRINPTGTTTQPVSGTITANLAAGTNNIGDVDVLSLPALPAGTNNIGDVDVLSLPSIPAGTNNIGDVDIATLPATALAAGNLVEVDYDSGAGTQNVPMVGLSLPGAGGAVPGGTATAPFRTDPTGATTQPVSGTVTANAGSGSFTVAQATAANLNATVSGTVTANAGSGNFTVVQPLASALKIDLSDTAANTTALKVDGSASTQPISGTVTANAGTGNFTVVQATPANLNATVTGTVTTVGDVASGSADSGNPVKTGGIGRTTNPTAVADGSRVNSLHDKLGRTVVVLNQVRDLEAHATTTISSTTETTILSAVASTFLDITCLICCNTSATDVRIDFRDATAGSVIFSLLAPAGNTVGFVPPVPVKQAAVNNNWTAQLSAAATDVRIFIQAVKNI